MRERERESILYYYYFKKKINDVIKVKNRGGGPINALQNLAPKRATRTEGHSATCNAKLQLTNFDFSVVFSFFLFFLRKRKISPSLSPLSFVIFSLLPPHVTDWATVSQPCRACTRAPRSTHSC